MIRSLGVALVVLLVPVAALAYERTMTCSTTAGALIACEDGEEPRPVAWPGRCVGYHVNIDSFDAIESDVDLDALIDDAFAAWSDVDGSYIELIRAGDTDENRAGYSPGCTSSGNANVVMLVSDGWPHQRSAVGITSVTYDPTTGEVYDADIEINDEFFRIGAITNPIAQIRTTDLLNTLTHEVGHFVGLDHTRAETFVSDGGDTFEQATMFASTDPGETSKRSLHLDDMTGLRAIYPADAVAEAEPCSVANEGFFDRPSTAPGSACEVDTGCGGCGAAPATGHGLLFGGAFVLFVLRRRRA